jgi:hypothetical protein
MKHAVPIMIAFAPAFATCAFAQGTSPDSFNLQEKTYNDIGSSIQNRQNNLHQLQQNQFETNHMRGQMERLRNTPSAPEPVIPLKPATPPKY